MIVKRIIGSLVLVLLLALSLTVGAVPSGRKKQRQPSDSSLVLRLQDVNRGHKMSTSMYPVRIQQIGRALQIKSDHNQILPVYTRNGTFYMAVRLNKGDNWLSGLPRGHYFINNRPVNIP